jgi:hypothetical protein
MVGMSESLADQVVRSSYEQIVGSIKHSGVREILRHRIKLHRDEYLVGERRRAAEADLQRIVEKTGGVR